MRANRILAIGTTTWRVLAAFDFVIQELSGRAALVEGATLLLLRPDTLLEGLPLLEIEQIGDAEPVSDGSAIFRATVMLKDGRSLLLSGELPDLDLLQRWVGYLRTRQRRGSRVR